MKIAGILFLLVVPAAAVNANPLSKVFDLIDGLKQRIRSDAEVEAKAYQKFASFCGTTSKDVQYEIDTSSTLGNKLTAKVTELASDIEVGETKISDLASSTAKDEAELNEATAIRKKEAEEFVEAQKALMTTVDTLERALSTLEKQVNTGGSFAQIDNTELINLVQSLSVIDDAAALGSSNLEALTSLIQSQDEDSDSEMGAPAAAAYKKQSGGIMDILEDMKEKADTQLAALRNTETKAKNSFSLLRQGLQDEIAAAKGEMSDAKSGKAEASEEKASGEGNLEVTKKEKAGAEKKNDELSSNCQTSAADHEANVAAQKEELKVINEAEKILRDATSGAASSFLQVSASANQRQRAKAKQIASAGVIRMVSELAKQQHSASLAQLASRISAELKYGAVRHSADPFVKVRDLVNSMISKLEKEAAADASEKAYCDEEMSKTKVKNAELEDTVAKMSAKIDKAASKSAQLKEEVAELQNELSVLTKQQASMDAIRREENAAYTATKADLEQGLNGVRKALSVLREFYGSGDAAASASMIQEGDDESDDMASLMQEAKQPAPPQKHEKSSGAGTGIISLLEVCESDLAKNLATEDAEESDSATSYEKMTQSNKITNAEKGQDVKGKTSQFKGLDKSISDLEADRATESAELSAVSEYYGKVKDRCIAKPTPYEELKARRDAEIQGLKDALASIEGAALMQTTNRRQKGNSLRGGALRTDDEE